MSEKKKPEPKIPLEEKKQVEGKKPEESMPSSEVKVRVLVGTLSSELGTYQKGEVFTTTRQRAAQFGNDVEIC